MGLDMFLTKRTHVYHYGAHDTSPQASVTYPGVRSERVSDITERMGVWRKANAIHQWFVDNVQDGEDDCREAHVEVDQLRKLMDAVNQVLEDRTLAPTLLPTQGGFFFGSLDYDQYYFEDLELTQQICKNAITESESDGSGMSEYIYQSSW